jgi:hypothetical protein
VAKKSRKEAAMVRKTARLKREKKAQLRPKGLGGHSLQKDPRGGWRCRVCKHHSINWSRIAPKRCVGSAISNWATAASKLAPQDVPQGGGHVRVLSGETLWCSRCGGHASNFAKSLRYPCTGSPFLTWNGGVVVKKKVGRSVNLKFLKAGIHPVTHNRMPPPNT